LPLVDFIQMVGNFTPEYAATAFHGSGYFDPWSLDASDIAEPERLSGLEGTRKSLRVSTGNMVTYDLLFRPPSGILNSAKPLMPKKEIILSFDRATSELGLINKSSESEGVLAGKVLPLKNVFLRARYYSTPFLRNYFSTIENGEISFNYDECSVYHKNLPQGDSIIRLANIIGGNTPKYLFAGIIESDALMGDYTKCSTAFKRHGVSEFDLTLNGYSCHGFPLMSVNQSPVQVYDKFLKATNRSFRNSCSKQISPSDFSNFAYLYAHKFEGESTESGWLGINLKLENAFDKNYVLGKCKKCNRKKFNLFYFKF